MSDAADPNPYASQPDEELPPGPSPAAEISLEVQRFRWIAVVVGLACDIGTTQIFSIAYLLVLAVQLGNSPALQDRLMAAMTAMPHVGILFVAGSGFSVLGGYVNGIVAKNRELEHGAAQAVASILLSSLMRWSTRGSPQIPLPTWFRWAGFVLVVPSVLLGSWLARRRRELHEA